VTDLSSKSTNSIEQFSSVSPARHATILAICTAYESGFGHGVKRDQLVNPYGSYSNEWVAHGIGYEAGVKRSLQIETNATLDNNAGEPLGRPRVPVGGSGASPLAGTPEEPFAPRASVTLTEKDAARYEWLRENWLAIVSHTSCSPFGRRVDLIEASEGLLGQTLDPQTLDQAIDAAIEREDEKGAKEPTAPLIAHSKSQQRRFEAQGRETVLPNKASEPR